MTGGFRKLSNQATPGPWERYGLNAIGSVPERTCVVLTQNTVDDQRRDDADFIVALVNAYRAGQLIEAPEPRNETGAQAYMRNLLAGNPSPTTRAAAEDVIEAMTGQRQSIEDFVAASLVGSLNETQEAKNGD